MGNTWLQHVPTQSDPWQAWAVAKSKDESVAVSIRASQVEKSNGVAGAVPTEGRERDLVEGCWTDGSGSH